MKKAIKWISCALIGFGFVLMLGTAGASDVDAICIDMAIIRCILSVALIGAGLATAYIIDKKEN